MKIRGSIIYTVVLSLLLSNQVNAQSISGYVKDKESHSPIAGVFVFFENSSIGTISDEQGYYELSSNTVSFEQMVFTHINYDLKSEKVSTLKDSIFLTPQQFVLDEVVISKKAKDRDRPKRLKKFQKALLGKLEKKNSVKLVNPEVLLFEEKKGKLLAHADVPLIIDNKYLGYKLQFFLKEFELSSNDDLRYQASAFFEPLAGSIKEEIRFNRNRVKTYQKGSRSFFQDLVKRHIDEEKYELGYATLNWKADITSFESIDVNTLDIVEQNPNTFEINIKGNLTVVHKDINITVVNSFHNSLSATINTTVKNVKKTPKQLQATTSFIARNSKIVFDNYGMILNPLEIMEVGHWSESRVANLLPLDYQPVKATALQ